MKPGRLLVLVAVAHAVVALVGYHDSFVDMLRAGVVNTVGRCVANACGDVRPAATASFFLLAAPLMGLVGYLLDRVIAARDAGAVRVVAVVLLFVGLVGAPIAPLTPLWLLPPFAVWLLRIASSVSA